MALMQALLWCVVTLITILELLLEPHVVVFGTEELTFLSSQDDAEHVAESGRQAERSC